MPRLLDFSTAYETTTTDGGLTLPMPAYTAGSLVFVSVTGDTGTPTWGCSNGVGTWNIVFQRTNTCCTVVFWKYCAASGEGDIVVTSNVTETYNGCAQVWEDVFQGHTVGSPPVQTNVAQASSTRFNMPTLTTSAADSAVLCIIGSSAVAQAHLCEGVAHLVAVSDGLAEGSGYGWFYRAAAGLTPADVKGAMNLAGVGVAAVIEVRAPAGGATLRPAYTVSDASILLTPQPGAAWDGNTAFAATADTNFGTSIAGRVCNDATVSTAVNDIGLDPAAFMAFAGLTNVASSTAMSGAEAVVAAARYNVGTRNILGHFRGPTAIANQTLSPVSGGRGIWFGLKSGATAATDWKVWQVHGADAQKPGYFQPFVVNAGNTDTIATAGTLSNADVRRYGFWRGGQGSLTGQACFGPIWAMDTQVIAGGTSATPLELPDIVRAVADQKLRISALLQGANQALMLQAVQFGNGGTNPAFLDLRAAAIEFAARRNAPKKLVNYNGTDNSIGYTFYPGASDVFDLRGAVFSSPSLFHWRWHASMSLSATVLVGGAQLFGAGDVQLRAFTLPATAFSDCATITQNGATLTGCSFANSKIFSDNPALISGCTFASGAAAGHAIEATAGGSFTLNGNLFSGYGASGTTNAAFYNNSGAAITLNIGSGDTPTVRNGAGASTTVVATKTKTFTGLPSGTEIRIRQGSYTLAQQQDVTTGSYAYAHPVTDAPARAQFTLPGFVFEDIDFVLNGSDQPFAVTFAPDPSYTTL